MEPLISSSINPVFIKSFQDLQDQLLLTTSTEDFTDPTTRSKLLQLTKEKGIEDITNNTTVDTFNYQDTVKYLYKKNRTELREN